ncbi:MAG: response regulator transcription factor [Veillonella sp.]|uniref:response regulator transcription factor n=1 Tax=Veillonella sp. TaxID=1926307 RepID=UPI0025E80593|nr:response regulator transcription factor [Veillonella sp.]MBS4913842.1 response regulator transcription factor [Veillonella sp.]
MKRILIIEDDQAIGEIERDYLELNQFEVELIADGQKGMDRALSGDFDLILLDVMLPSVDGFTICKTLRETLNIPILMVTAKQEDIDKIRGLGLGADDYIEKPFSPSILVARVKAHLAQYDRLTKVQGQAPQEKEITIGNLRIQTGSHRVFVKDEEVHLKNKEYELLLFLIRNAELVFDKETLYERIWGLDAIGDVATVAVHINRLREKIEENPSDPKHIETVWGVGYRFKI